MEIPEYEKEHLNAKAHNFAIDTLISRHYPEYEAIKNQRMKVLFKLNSHKETNGK